MKMNNNKYLHTFIEQRKSTLRMKLQNDRPSNTRRYAVCSKHQTPNPKTTSHLSTKVHDLIVYYTHDVSKDSGHGFLQASLAIIVDSEQQLGDIQRCDEVIRQAVIEADEREVRMTIRVQGIEGCVSNGYREAVSVQVCCQMKHWVNMALVWTWHQQ